MTRDQLFKALEDAGLDFNVGESFDGIQYISFLVNDKDFGSRDDWEVIKNLGNPDGYIIMHSASWHEWQDEKGDYLQFDTLEQATTYLDDFFQEVTQ